MHAHAHVCCMRATFVEATSLRVFLLLSFHQKHNVNGQLTTPLTQQFFDGVQPAIHTHTYTHTHTHTHTGAHRHSAFSPDTHTHTTSTKAHTHTHTHTSIHTQDTIRWSLHGDNRPLIVSGSASIQVTIFARQCERMCTPRGFTGGNYVIMSHNKHLWFFAAHCRPGLGVVGGVSIGELTETSQHNGVFADFWLYKASFTPCARARVCVCVCVCVGEWARVC